MAREKMITRTISGYTVNALCVNIPTATVENGVFTVGADFNPEKGLEMLRKIYENAKTAIAAITSYARWEQLRGMSEQSFMEFAVELPPRGESGRTRERMITRTISGYEVQCLVMDMETREMMYPIFTMGGDYNPDKGLQKIRDTYESDQYKIVAILATNKFEKLYGMSEKQFIELSEELPPRGNTTEE